MPLLIVAVLVAAVVAVVVIVTEHVIFVALVEILKMTMENITVKTKFIPYTALFMYHRYFYLYTYNLLEKKIHFSIFDIFIS